MSNPPNRKSRIVVNSEISEQVKWLYKSKGKRELLEITSWSNSALNSLIIKIGTCEDNDPRFEDLYNTAGRKKVWKSILHSKIRSLFGTDN